MAKEKEAFGITLNETPHQSMRYNGDRIYDTLFVKSGAEGVAYSALREPDDKDIAGAAVRGAIAAIAVLIASLRAAIALLLICTWYTQPAAKAVEGQPLVTEEWCDLGALTAQVVVSDVPLTRDAAAMMKAAHELPP